MATFDFQITEADMGRALGVPDGYLVNLARTKAGINEMPQWSPATRQWTAGRFVLRGSGDFRDLVCIDTGAGAGWAGHSGSGSFVFDNASVGYAGDLIVVCCQRGSIWQLTLSDQPYVPPPPPPLLFGWPISREAELVRR